MYPEQVNNNYERDGVLLYGLQGTSFYKETKENKVVKQYINKSALVAEIEKRLEAIANASPEDNKQFAAIRGAQHYELISLVRFINTIETKEVDLEEAVDDAKDLAMRDMAWNVHVMISEGKSIGEIDHYVCGICDF